LHASTLACINVNGLDASEALRSRAITESPQTTRSGTRLFAITSECIDLTTQLIDALLITAGHRHSKGEFELFELVTAFGITPDLTSR